VPPSVTKFGAASFDLNCLSNYTTQAWCPLPNSQLQALTDLYSSTKGGGWLASTRWLIGDPCLNTWFGVTCGALNTSVT
jgi:hypothetical protein